MQLLSMALLVVLQSRGDSALQSHAALDSLYRARDTAALVKTLRTWRGESTARVEFYRGIAAAWTGQSRQAIALLQPLLDSSRSVLTQSQRRDAIRALAESFSRVRRYGDAAALYDGELSALDAQVDSERHRAARVDTVRAEPLIDQLPSLDPAPAPSLKRIQGQVGLLGLLFALFLLPKMLQRFRIPGAVTALLMGAGATALGWFPDDPTLRLLSTLGIVSLFLFAGLEIDGSELRRNARPLILHALIWALLAGTVATAAALFLDLPYRAAALLSLALVTPSTGFILSSLASFGLAADEQRAVRTYAIGSELIALAVMFFVLQSTSVRQLALSLAAMAGVVIVIPVAFRAFAALVAPYAPRSEFAFLLMVGIACAYATRLLGVYYLVGAFLVGVAAQRYRASHPAMSSEKIIDALEAFGSVFIPFYFFHAGTDIASENVTLLAAAIGFSLVVVLVPIRIGVITLHRRIVLREASAVSRRIGSAMVPTLVFTLIIAGILTERFNVSPTLAGALVLYTIINTALPAYLLKSRPAEFEDVAALPLEEQRV